MKTRVMAIMIILFSSILFARNANLISPSSKGKTTIVQVNGKKYIYWICEPDESLYYDIIGSGSVTIYIRTEAKVNPNVRICIDGRKVKKLTLNEPASKKSKNKLLKNISKAKKVHLKIPKGKHRLVISSDKKILVRTVKGKSIRYYAYVPQKHSGGMVLVSHETEYGYYKSIENHPVQCEIIGPGRIKVLTRYLYTQEMMGNQHYSVSVSIDAGKPTIYEFETQPSTVAFFRTDSDIVPSKAGKIEIEIPPDSHNVIISPTNSNPIAVRILIPDSMLKRR